MKCASFSFQISKEAQERKNTSLDASSEGASDGPTKKTSKEAKLHGLWQCPLQCVFGVLSFRGFSLDASQTQQYFGAYLFSTPSRTPRGKSISLRQSVSRFNETFFQSVLFSSFHCLVTDVKINHKKSSIFSGKSVTSGNSSASFLIIGNNAGTSFTIESHNIEKSIPE